MWKGKESRGRCPSGWFLGSLKHGLGFLNAMVRGWSVQKPDLGLSWVVGTKLLGLWVGDWHGDWKPCCAIVEKFTKCLENLLLGRLPQNKPKRLGRVYFSSLVLCFIQLRKGVGGENSSPCFLNLEVLDFVMICTHESSVRSDYWQLPSCATDFSY